MRKPHLSEWTALVWPTSVAAMLRVSKSQLACQRCQRSAGAQRKRKHIEFRIMSRRRSMVANKVYNYCKYQCCDCTGSAETRKGRESHRDAESNWQRAHMTM